MTKLPRGRKTTSKSKAKPNKPTGRLNRAQYAGYESWLQFRVAYGLYLDESTSTLDSAAYAQLIDGGVLGAYAFHHDVHFQSPTINFSSLITTPPTTIDEDEASTSPTHLYALDIDDLVDFTGDDVLQAWERRAHSCGSQEAAAEMFALYRVLNGDDELYAGATTYLYHPDVLAIFNTITSEEATIQDLLVDADVPDLAIDNPPELVEAKLLSLADIRDLTTDQLKSAWGNRPDSFASLEAAAETLAILRSLNAADPVRPSYRGMMQHELVIELEDSLPLEIRAQAPSPAAELELLKVDRRTVRTQVSVTRPGQGSFRAAMLDRYGSQCCITGCKVDTLLEAAHIIPYRGDQSDDVTNGLLLRVDLHRLFDAHLISINPTTLAVEVARRVDDSGYQAFHGKRLFAFSPKPRILFIETHYQAFSKPARIGKPS